MANAKARRVFGASMIVGLVILVYAGAARSDDGEEDLATWSGFCEVNPTSNKLDGNCVGSSTSDRSRSCLIKQSAASCPTTTSVTDKSAVACGAGTTAHFVSRTHACN